MNFPLLSAVFTIASTVIMGVLVVVAIVTGFDTGLHIVGAIGAGFLISLPVSFVVAKKIGSLGGSNQN